MTIKDIKLIELPRFMDPRGNLSFVNTLVGKLTSSPSVQYVITSASIAQPVAHSSKIGQHWTLLQRSRQTF